jgi:hypothetical protein
VPEARLTFSHQDGTLGFRVVEARYIVSKGMLSLSLSCAANRRHEFMGEPHFAAHNLSVGGRPKLNQVFEVREQFVPGTRLDVPRVHLYVGEHFQPRDTRIEVVGVGAGELAVRGAFVVDDPVYYDKRAKDTPTRFFAMFSKGREQDLWAPF